MEGFVATKLHEFEQGKISRSKLIETLTAPFPAAISFTSPNETMSRLYPGYLTAFNAFLMSSSAIMLDGFLAAVGVDHTRRHSASIKRREITPTAKHNRKRQD